MTEYVMFTEEFLRDFYNPATCSYMVPVGGKVAHDIRVLRDENTKLKVENTALKVENTRLQAENVMLRELARKYSEYASQDRCLGCVCKRSCNNGDIDECWLFTEIREAAHELGIEVYE